MLRVLIVIAATDVLGNCLASYANIGSLAALEELQGSPIRVKYGAALLAYVVLTIAHAFARTWQGAAALGASIYAAYALTNLALLDDYPWSALAVDSTIGAAAFALAFLATDALRRTTR